MKESRRIERGLQSQQLYAAEFPYGSDHHDTWRKRYHKGRWHNRLQSRHAGRALRLHRRHERQIIPGLYCSGNSQGDRFAVNYPFKLSGASHAMAMFYGKVAGENAAAGK